MLFGRIPGGLKPKEDTSKASGSLLPNDECGSGEDMEVVRTWGLQRVHDM